MKISFLAWPAGILLGICLFNFLSRFATKPDYLVPRISRNGIALERHAAAKGQALNDAPLNKRAINSSTYTPQRVYTAEDVLYRLSELQTRYAGPELANEQMKFLGQIASNGEIETWHLLELAKDLHISVADNYLPQGWNTILNAAVGRADFELSDFISEFPTGRLASDLLRATGASMASRGRRPTAEELALLEKTTGNENYITYLTQFAATLAVYDSRGALDFAEFHKADLGKNGLCSVIFNLESPNDYEFVAKSNLLRDSAGAYNIDMISSLASGWAAADPQAAASWVETLSDSQIKENAAKALVERWSTYDLQGAAKWLASTDTQGLDSSIGVLVNRLARYSPDEARHWAALIKDEEARTRFLAGIKLHENTAPKQR